MHIYKPRFHFIPQSSCWSCRASGIIVQIIVSTAVTVHRLRRTASTCCTGTEGFTTTTNSLPSEPFTKPYTRWARLSAILHILELGTRFRPLRFCHSLLSLDTDRTRQNLRAVHLRKSVSCEKQLSGWMRGKSIKMGHTATRIVAFGLIRCCFHA